MPYQIRYIDVKQACKKILTRTCHVQFSSVQSLSRVRLFETPWTIARQTSLSITNSQSPLKPMSIESVMPSNHLILCHPLLLASTFPASGSFQMSQLFASGGQSTGVWASTSVLPVNTQDWSLISWLQSICSDFGAQKNKVSHCFPIYLPWSDGTGCHDLSFLNVEL